MRIGVDLGGTKIEAVMMDPNGAIVERKRVATPAGDYEGTVKTIAALISELEQPLSESATVGVATPGSISPVTGKMRNCNSTCLNHQPLLEDLKRVLGRDVRIANDADCFTLSEAKDGAAMGYERVFGVILGTGVGGGICQYGRLLEGANGIAGEWGHNPLPPLKDEWRKYQSEGRSCYCGWQDCIETYLSGPGFERGHTDATGKRLSAAQIVQRAEQGESEAQQQLELYQERLAAALGAVINLLDPHMIVLGGGMSNIAGLYTEVPERWRKYIFSDACRTELRPPQYGDSSGVRGAAWLW